MQHSNFYLSEWTSDGVFGSLSLSTKAIHGLEQSTVSKFEIKSFQEYLAKLQNAIALLLKSHSKHYFFQDSEMVNIEQQAKALVVEGVPFKQAYNNKPVRKLLRLICNLLKMTSNVYFKNMPEDLQENFVILRSSFIRLCASEFPTTFRKNFLLALSKVKDLPENNLNYGQIPLTLGESRMLQPFLDNADASIVCRSIMYISYFIGKGEIECSSESFQKLHVGMTSKARLIIWKIGAIF